jgi:hypothetical protein
MKTRIKRNVMKMRRIRSGKCREFYGEIPGSSPPAPSRGGQFWKERHGKKTNAYPLCLSLPGGNFHRVKVFWDFSSPVASSRGQSSETAFGITISGLFQQFNDHSNEKIIAERIAHHEETVGRDEFPKRKAFSFF